MVKRLAQSAFHALFANPLFRKRAIFHLKQYYYGELAFFVDLGYGYRCPIFEASAQYSFTEIFFDDEYAGVFELIDLPGRWLDLGCHYGFFSLYVAWMKNKQCRDSSFGALLVDADSRVYNGLSSLLTHNNLSSHFIFMHGAIASGNGFVDFNQRNVMSSSLAQPHSDSRPSRLLSVPIIDSSTILNAFSPPYDLVKIDVEGGEYDFLLSYGQVLAEAKHLVIEWHSWHRGGGSYDQIRTMAESHGFHFRKEIQPPKDCGENNSGLRVGVFLFSK
jgi:FkbM family methyltransferase